jgi:hypothetical protein
MRISKKQYKKLEALLISNSAMLVALTEQLQSEGKLNGNAVMERYNKGFEELIKTFGRK